MNKKKENQINDLELELEMQGYIDFLLKGKKFDQDMDELENKVIEVIANSNTWENYKNVALAERIYEHFKHKLRGEIIPLNPGEKQKFRELTEKQQFFLLLAAMVGYGNLCDSQHDDYDEYDGPEPPASDEEEAELAGAKLRLTNELYDEFKTATTAQKQKIIQEIEKTHKPLADALKNISEKEKQGETASEPVRSETDPGEKLHLMSEDEKLCLMSAMECFDQWAEQPDATETASRNFFEEATGVKKGTPLAKLFSIYYAGFSAGGKIMANFYNEIQTLKERKDGTGK